MRFSLYQWPSSTVPLQFLHSVTWLARYGLGSIDRSRPIVVLAALQSVRDIQRSEEKRMVKVGAEKRGRRKEAEGSLSLGITNALSVN